MGRAYEVRKASILKNGAVKAKLYSNYAKEIYTAAKRGVPELESNVELKRIVDKAKRDEVPNDIILRAIEKAKGSAGDDYKTVIYEGFGPGKSTLIIKCMTDNVNRTVGEARAAFNKVNKSLGVTNSVLYNYDYLGIISIKYDNEEQILEKLINNDVDIIDIENDKGIISISMNPTYYNKVKDVLEKTIPNVTYLEDEIGYYPKELVTLEGEDLELFNKLIRIIDDIEDVSTYYHNVSL